MAGHVGFTDVVEHYFEQKKPGISCVAWKVFIAFVIISAFSTQPYLFNTVLFVESGYDLNSNY
jgi:hypothetical protein